MTTRIGWNGHWYRPCLYLAEHMVDCAIAQGSSMRAYPAKSSAKSRLRMALCALCPRPRGREAERTGPGSSWFRCHLNFEKAKERGERKEMHVHKHACCAVVLQMRIVVYWGWLQNTCFGARVTSLQGWTRVLMLARLEHST